MGRSHAVSGVAVGVWSSLAAGALGVPVPVWVGSVVAGSIGPDVDHPRATVAGMWGPVSRGPARLIGWLAGGHRGGTHTVLAALAVTVGLSVLDPSGWVSAVAWGVLAGVFLAAVAAILRGKLHPAVNLTPSALVVYVAHMDAWPVAVAGFPLAVGWLIHLAGDHIPCGTRRERATVLLSYAAIALWAALPLIITKLP